MLISISGVDRSGKDLIRKKINEIGEYRFFIVVRDPSCMSFYDYIRQERNAGLSDSLKRERRYTTTVKQFKQISPMLNVFLKISEDAFINRSIRTGEPELPGEYSFNEHQQLMLNMFEQTDYTNTMIISNSDDVDPFTTAKLVYNQAVDLLKQYKLI